MSNSGFQKILYQSFKLVRRFCGKFDWSSDRHYHNLPNWHGSFDRSPDISKESNHDLIEAQTKLCYGQSACFRDFVGYFFFDIRHWRLTEPARATELTNGLRQASTGISPWIACFHQAVVWIDWRRRADRSVSAGGLAARECPQNRLLRFCSVGTLRVPRIFPAFHEGKMAVRPFTARESPVMRTFPSATKSPRCRPRRRTSVPDPAPSTIGRNRCTGRPSCRAQGFPRR